MLKNLIANSGDFFGPTSNNFLLYIIALGLIVLYAFLIKKFPNKEKFITAFALFVFFGALAVLIIIETIKFIKWLF